MMADGVRGANLSQGWLPVAAVAAIIGVAVSLTWGAATVSNRLDAQSVQLQTLADKVDRLPSRGEMESLQRDSAALRSEVQEMKAWIATTRIQLAEQGYKTPPYPKEPEK